MSVSQLNLAAGWPVPVADVSQWGMPLTGGWFIGLLCGAGLLYLFGLLTKRDARSRAQDLLEQAQLEAANLSKQSELETRERLLKLQTEAERELQAERETLRQREMSLDRREESLQQTANDLRQQEKFVEGNQNKLSQRLERVKEQLEEQEKLRDRLRGELESLSGLDRQQAAERLLKLLEKELSEEIDQRLLKHERRVAELADQKSREILLTAMQRYASAHTAEATTSTIDIPTDDMKGRIIGREGRNIRAFEKATGVDLIIDDTPGVVIVSGFDPVRREVARQSLERLIADGRIHPARIEELVQETQKQMETFVRRKGQEAVEEVDLGGLPEKLVPVLGRLHFRTSYRQNVLRHSIEVAFLAGIMAEMIGLDGKLARRCGLLHDIGKASDHELEGGHPKIGADLLKRCGERPEVVHAALGHHDQLLTEYPYTLLVATADACSASRPGARRESLENYIKRMEELERIAKGFEGVEQAFAIQAGRELRVMVSAKQVDDAKAAGLCRGIARAFEQQLTYPGEIKITVIRESRFTEVAR